MTGVLLAVARIAGETAPLLMVGCNSNLWNVNPRGQLASLPVEIYVLRDAPSDLALHQLWGVALVLVVLVLILKHHSPSAHAQQNGGKGVTSRRA